MTLLLHPVPGTQMSLVCGLPASQASGGPAVQAPAMHTSAVVQIWPSLQEAPSAFGGFEQIPVAGLHVPGSWHWSCATQLMGAPAVHTPALHVSFCVQALPSLQAAPSARSQHCSTGVKRKARGRVPGSPVPTIWPFSLMEVALNHFQPAGIVVMFAKTFQPCWSL